MVLNMFTNDGSFPGVPCPGALGAVPCVLPGAVGGAPGLGMAGGGLICIPKIYGMIRLQGKNKKALKREF